MNVIDILYKKELANWEALYCGWMENRITKEIIIEHAISEIQEGRKKEILFSLAGADHEDANIITGYLLELIDRENINCEYENKKWLLCYLIKIKESDIDDSIKLEQLQNVYSDFGYPELMKSCSIYYMPQDHEITDKIIDPLAEMEKVIEHLQKEI